MLTAEEKDLLFEEFEERLRYKQREKSNGTLEQRSRRNLSPAREYFNSRRKDVSGFTYPGWEIITKLVCKTFSVRSVGYLSDDQLEMANEFAKKVIDLYFDYYVKANGL